MTSIPGQKVPTYLLIIEAREKYKRLLLQRNTEDVYIYWIYQFFSYQEGPASQRWHILYHVENFIYPSSIKQYFCWLYNHINTRAHFPCQERSDTTKNLACSRLISTYYLDSCCNCLIQTMKDNICKCSYANNRIKIHKSLTNSVFDKNVAVTKKVAIKSLLFEIQLIELMKQEVGNVD